MWDVTIPYPLDVYDRGPFRAEVDCINASIRAAAKAAPDVSLLDLGEQLCPKGICQREFEQHPIRPDGVHYTIEGAASLSRWALDEIQR